MRTSQQPDEEESEREGVRSVPLGGPGLQARKSSFLNKLLFCRIVLLNVATARAGARNSGSLPLKGTGMMAQRAWPWWKSALLMTLGMLIAGPAYSGRIQSAGSAAQRSTLDSATVLPSLEARANAAYRDGHFDEARQLLEEIIKRDPRSARAYALLGLTRARQNDLQGAIRNLRQAHQIEPQSSDYAYDYSVVLLQDGQFAAAIPILEKVRRQENQAPDVLLNLARAYAGARQFQKLSASLQNLPPAYYSNLQLLKALAEILGGAGQASAAAALWKAAIRHNPDQPLSYAALAELWIAQGQAKRALALLDGAPAAARGPVYLYAYARAQMASKEYAQAAQKFQQLTVQFPKNQSVWNQLITCNLLAGRLNEAENVAEEAARNFPHALEFPYQQAVVNYMLGRTATAVKILTPLVDDGGGDPRPVLLMAVLQSENGNYSQAVRYFSREEQMKSGCNALASYFYGATLLRMNRTRQAETELEKAIQCRPRFTLAEYRLGQALYTEGKLDQASTMLEKATRDDPKLAEPYYELAKVRRRLGDAAGAGRALARYTSLVKHVPTSDRDLLGSSLR